MERIKMSLLLIIKCTHHAVDLNKRSSPADTTKAKATYFAKQWQTTTTNCAGEKTIAACVMLLPFCLLFSLPFNTCAVMVIVMYGWVVAQNLHKSNVAHLTFSLSHSANYYVILATIWIFNRSNSFRLSLFLSLFLYIYAARSSCSS